MRYAKDQLPKGLVPKWAVRPHSSAEAARECHVLGAFKIEYAQDAEGRIWRRIHRVTRRDKWATWSDVVRWHVADMYAWFPGEDPATMSGARRQNTSARPPKGIDVYLVDNKPLVMERA